MTEEDIVLEGWTPTLVYPNGECIFQKGTKEDGYELIYSFNKKECSIARLNYFGLDDIYNRTPLFLYAIECPDIDTLRTIFKLFKI